MRRAADRLERAGLSPDDSRRDAAVLARATLGWDLAEWLVRQRETPPADFPRRFDALLSRRAAREPVAYLLGTREFYGRPFRVSRDVLIPRPETELLVDTALTIMREIGSKDARPLVIDVGTGSGCVAITLALEAPRCRVIATDISPAALRVADENARRLGAGDRISFREAALTGAMIDADLIVSNPPYIPVTDRESLMPDVRDFEPATALFGGEDGLAVIRALVSEAAGGALRPGGGLLIEIGAGQSNAVAALLSDRTIWLAPRVIPDLAAIPRVVVARRVPSV